MKLKGLIDEDFINYKKTSMFLVFPHCTFKCDKECGRDVCQNSKLAKESEIDISAADIVMRYISNPITHAVVCGGLEPFDSWDELIELLTLLRKYCQDDIVIYTGYTEQELTKKIKELKKFNHIIIKFGRFIPDMESHIDEILGKKLMSPNQYAKEI